MKDFIDDLIDDLLEVFNETRKTAVDYFKPFLNHQNVDVLEKNNEYIISIEMPGVEKENIKLDIKGNHLEVEFVKDEEHITKTINLNNDIDKDKIIAEYKNGVLKVTINKKEMDRKEIKII